MRRSDTLWRNAAVLAALALLQLHQLPTGLLQRAQGTRDE